MAIQQYSDHKRYLVLNLIQRLGAVSRTRLANLTGFRAATIGEIIKGLLDEKLLVESGSSSNGRGRRRTLLELNKEYLCAVGVSISDDNGQVSYILTTLGGRILKEAKTPLHTDLSGDAAAKDLAENIRRITEGFSDRKIIGIGIGDPGRDPCRRDMSKDFATTFLHMNDWLDLDLAVIEKEFSVPVELLSRVILPAVAEREFGVAKGMDDFVCFDLRNGIGMSFCCNGTVVRGAASMAGQIGHTVADGSEKLCYCGKTGCVDICAAFPALCGDIRRALADGVASSLSASYDGKRELAAGDIRKALDSGDRLCRHFAARSARLIGTAIANAVNILNPECIVLQGMMLDLGDFFLAELERAIRDNVLTVNSDVKIRVSRLAQDLLPLGAAAIVFSEYFRAEDFKWVGSIRDEADEA